MAKRLHLITSDEAVETNGQVNSPCSDCPWSRRSLPGWLGSSSKEEWIQAAHGEGMIECHTRLENQCAGAAIYRANMAKMCRDRSILRLPADRDKVFSTPQEFLDHHKKVGLPPARPARKKKPV